VKDQFEERGAAIVVVSFAPPERLVTYQRIHQWPFVLLADPDRNAYRYFDLKRLPWYRVFSPSTLRLYLSLLLKGRRIQNYGKDDYFQAGGDFLPTIFKLAVIFFLTVKGPSFSRIAATIPLTGPRSRDCLRKLVGSRKYDSIGGYRNYSN
jgi:hypothetical protein